MNGNFYARRFQHLLDQAAPDVAAAVIKDIDRLGWQPRIAATAFRALRPLAIDGSLDRASLVKVAGQVAKNAPGRDLNDVLAAVFALPKKSFAVRDKALDALAADGQLDALHDLLVGADLAALDAAAAFLVRPSISSFNRVWEPLMAGALKDALNGVATVTQNEAASLRAVADAKSHGATIDKPDAFISRAGVMLAHSELKGTSERNQGDDATDRIIREVIAFCRVPTFAGLRYVGFISGDGFQHREYFKRFDALEERRFVLCTTEAEAPIFRGLGSRRVLSLTELAAVVASW